MQKQHANKWNMLSEKDWAKCAVFNIKEQVFAHPDGRQGSFYVSETKDWVQVFALTCDKKIVLVKQYRFGIQGFSIEPAGGVIEDGECPINAGIRELQEETGYVGKNPILIGKVSSNPAIMDNYSHFLLISDCEKLCETNFDENEDVECIVISLDELDAMVAKGEMHHSISLAGLYFLKKYLDGQS